MIPSTPVDLNALSVRMLELRFHSSVPTAFNQVLVASSHWTEAEADALVDGDGSKRPATFLYYEAPTATATIELTGTGDRGSPATLHGDLAGLQLRGSLRLSDGSQSVLVSISDLGGGIARYSGDATWTFDCDQLSGPIALPRTTRLELFAILGQPADFFQTQGVWAEALRLLSRIAGGASDPLQVARRVTWHCHWNQGFRYDTGGGPSAYSMDDRGGVFRLRKFLMQGIDPLVNCFDLAAGVKVLCGAAGVEVDWLVIDEFGFLRTTHLVGVGLCNNPIFPPACGCPLLSRLDSNRQGFEMHAVGECAGVIFDSCAGPHLGSEDRASYERAAMDPLGGSITATFGAPLDDAIQGLS